MLESLRKERTSRDQVRSAKGYYRNINRGRTKECQRRIYKENKIIKIAIKKMKQNSR